MLGSPSPILLKISTLCGVVSAALELRSDPHGNVDPQDFETIFSGLEEKWEPAGSLLERHQKAGKATHPGGFFPTNSLERSPHAFPDKHKVAVLKEYHSSLDCRGQSASVMNI